MPSAPPIVTHRRTLLLLAAGVVALMVAWVVSGEDESPALAGATPTATPTSTLDVEGDTGLLVAAAQRIAALDEPLPVWLALADCESGEWDADAEPRPGSARWAWGTRRDTRFEGGLHFEPSTWDQFRDPSMPEHAGDAGPLTQVEVAERVLEEQGWEAWPVCSRKIGAR